VVFSKFDNFCVAISLLSSEVPATYIGKWCKSLHEVISELIGMTKIMSLSDIINENANSKSYSDTTEVDANCVMTEVD